MLERSKNKNNKPDPSWTPYNYNGVLFIQRKLFKRGITAVETTQHAKSLAYPLRYDLSLMPENTDEIKPGKLYVKKEGNSLHYTVIGINGKPVKGIITPDELTLPLTEPFQLDKLRPFLADILKITAKKGHTYTVSDSKFILKERQLIFSNDSGDIKPDLKFAEKTHHLLAAIKKIANKGPISSSDTAFNKEDFFIYNAGRREEIFFPLTLNHQGQELGFYLYPWLSHKSRRDDSVEISGFEQFVTAGCMFGPNLRATDQHGGTYALIKHDIKFFAEQKFGIIDYDAKASNPYEEMQTNEFEKLVCFINQFSNPKQPKNLLYHLPYYDYVLFGVELFIRGRITLQALDNFFKIILDKKEEHTQKLEAICNQFSIKIRVESPFENLLGCLSDQDGAKKSSSEQHQTAPKDGEKDCELARRILDILNLPANEVDPNSINNEAQEAHEEELVQSCLEKLQANSFNEEHRQVWTDFISITDPKEIKTLEHLFKVANAVMVGIGAKDKPDYKTCAIHPLSEKQIQVGYEECSNKIQKIRNSHEEVERKFHANPDKEILKHQNKINELEKNIIFHEQGSDQHRLEKIQRNQKEIERLTKEINKQETIIRDHEKEVAESAKKAEQITALEPAMKKYSGVLSITVLDSLVTYTPLNSGLPFYFGLRSDTLSDLITTRGILRTASENVSLFFNRTNRKLNCILDVENAPESAPTKKTP